MSKCFGQRLLTVQTGVRLRPAFIAKVLPAGQRTAKVFAQLSAGLTIGTTARLSVDQIRIKLNLAEDERSYTASVHLSCTHHFRKSFAIDEHVISLDEHKLNASDRHVTYRHGTEIAVDTGKNDSTRS